MKLLLLSVFMLVAFQSFSQSRLDSAIKLYSYKGSKVVFDTILRNDKSKSENFLAAKKWIAIHYNNYSSVVKLEDYESGLLIIKSLVDNKSSSSSPEAFIYTMEINASDKQSTVKIYDISNKGFSEFRTPKFYVTPIETLLERQKIRTDKNRERGYDPVFGYYKLFKAVLHTASEGINT